MKRSSKMECSPSPGNNLKKAFFVGSVEGWMERLLPFPMVGRVEGMDERLSVGLV
jgi:hypothetical protein